jgi:hypothetical protein
MAQILKSFDDKIYLDITDSASSLFGIIDLFVLWKKGDTTHRLPIGSSEELRFALAQEGKRIGIEVGAKEDILPVLNRGALNWSAVDTITHNGFIYVKYNDLLF